MNILQILGITVVASPALLLLVFGILPLLGMTPGERLMARCIQTAVVGGLLAAVTILVIMLVTGARHVPIELGDWVVLPAEHFHA